LVGFDISLRVDRGSCLFYRAENGDVAVMARIYCGVRYARVAKMARHDRAMQIVRLRFLLAFPL